MESKNKKKFHTYESYQPHQQPVDMPKKTRIASINAWLKDHKKIVLIVLVLFILAVGGTLIYLFTRLEYKSAPDVSTQPKRVEKIYSPLTGLEVNEAARNRGVTAIMIENSPEARPQSGLQEGGVVF